MNKRKVAGTDGRAWEENWRDDFFSFIFSFCSFSDLWKSDRRHSSEQKAKLVYAKRATHRYLQSHTRRQMHHQT